jgi:hypothetical protein
MKKTFQWSAIFFLILCGSNKLTLSMDKEPEYPKGYLKRPLHLRDVSEMPPTARPVSRPKHFVLPPHKKQTTPGKLVLVMVAPAPHPLSPGTIERPPVLFNVAPRLLVSDSLETPGMMPSTKYEVFFPYELLPYLDVRKTFWKKDTADFPPLICAYFNVPNEDGFKEETILISNPFKLAPCTEPTTAPVIFPYVYIGNLIAGNWEETSPMTNIRFGFQKEAYATSYPHLYHLFPDIVECLSLASNPKLFRK